MDFVFISMCITRSYYACLVLLICNDHYSTLGGGGWWQDAKRLSFSRETMELNLIHSFCPRRFVSVSFPHGLFHWGWDALLFASFKKKKKCNKCFQWITNFNIDPQPTCIFVTSLFGSFWCLCLPPVGHMILSWSFFFLQGCSLRLTAQVVLWIQGVRVWIVLTLEHYWLTPFGQIHIYQSLM